MKVITRYLLKNLMISFLLGLVLYSLLFFIQNLFVLSEIIVEKHAPPSLALAFIALYLPKIIVEVFPFVVLFAGAMTTGQLASNSELVVINAMGISIRRQVRPFLLFALLTTLAYSWLIFVTVPDSKIARNRVFNQIAQRAVVHAQQPGTFQEIGDDIYLRFRHAYVIDADTRKLSRVEVYQIDPRKGSIQVSQSESGVLSVSREQETLHLLLLQGDEFNLQFDNGQQTRLRYAEKQLSLPTEQFLNTPWPENARYYKMQTFSAFFKEWMNGNQIARAIAARRILLILFVFTAPLLAFGLGFKLQRGAGLSGAFLTSFFIGILVVVGAKMMESTLAKSKSPPEYMMFLIACIFIGYMIFLYHKLEVPSRTRRPSGKARKGALAIFLNGLKSLLDIRIVVPERKGTGKLMSRYVTRGFLRSLGMVFVIMEGVYLLFLTLNMIPEFLKYNEHTGSILLEMAYSVPATLPYVFPLAFVVAAFFYCSLMDDRSEIVALKSVGFSLHNIFSLLFRVGIASALFLTFLNTFLGPLSQRRADAVHAQIRNTAGTISEENHVFQFMFEKERSRFKTAYCFVQSVDPGTSSILRPVIALKTATDGPLIALFTARQISLQGNRWIADEGQWFFLKEGFKGLIKRSDIPMPDSFAQLLQASKPELSRLTSYQLRKLISRRKVEGTTPYPEITAYYARFASAFSPLILLIMGLPILFIGTGSRRRRPTVGIMMGIALVVGYYALSSLFQSLGTVHYLPPFLAAWMVNLICVVAGMLLVTMVRT